MTSQPKRRWLQFNLRALLVLTFGVACFCAGWLERQRELNREREAQEAIMEEEMERAMMAETMMEQALPDPFTPPDTSGQ